MRISMQEHEILKAVGEEDPTFSSIAKLVKKTGRARNEIIEIVEDLQKICFLKLTTKNEVYLWQDGREYLGIDTHGTSVIEKRESVKQEIKPAYTLSEVKTAPVMQCALGNTSKRKALLQQVDKVRDQLNVVPVDIADAELKVEVLEKISEMLSDDLRDLLLEVADDIKAISKINTPDEAA